MKNNIMKLFSFLVISLLISTSQAEELMMARTKQSFPEAMLKLQETIIDMGYKISRIQRIDIGLTKSGYQTDKYRIVFFTTAKDVAEISEKYPHLVPYIPWKIAIFAEQQDTLLVSANPMQFSNKKYPGADKYLLKWKNDTHKIMQILRKSE